MVRNIIVIVCFVAFIALPACVSKQRGAGIFAAPPVRVDDPFLPRIDNARELFDDGLFDQARIAVDALIADGATHPLIPLLRAKLAQQDEEWSTMVEWSRRAVLADPSWTEPRILLATACMEVHRYVEADAAFADIDRMAPKSAWGPYGRAWVAAHQQDMQRAITLMDEGLQREPEFLPGLLLRAHLARWAGDKTREEICLRQAAALGDPDAQQLARLGDLADEAGRQLEATRLYERSWALKHSRQVARRRLEIARRAGDTAAERIWSTRAGVP